MRRSGIFIDGRAASKRIGAFSEFRRELTDVDIADDDGQPPSSEDRSRGCLSVFLFDHHSVTSFVGYGVELHPDPLSVP